MKLTRKQFLGAAAASGVASLIASRTAPLAAAAAKPKKLEKTAITGATAATVRFIRETKAPAIPPAVFAQAKRCLIDGFGVILAGSTVRGSEIVREYVRAGDRQARRDGPRCRRPDDAGRARGAGQRRQRPRDGLRRHAAVDDAGSHLRAADAPDHAAAVRRRWPSAKRQGVSGARVPRSVPDRLRGRVQDRRGDRSRRITTAAFTRRAPSARSARPRRPRSC